MFAKRGRSIPIAIQLISDAAGPVHDLIIRSRPADRDRFIKGREGGAPSGRHVFDPRFNADPKSSPILARYLSDSLPPLPDTLIGRAIGFSVGRSTLDRWEIERWTVPATPRRVSTSLQFVNENC